MHGGDWLALIGMTIVIGALIIGHLRAVRAQRELDRRFGHRVRKSRAIGDARVTEQTWSSR